MFSYYLFVIIYDIVAGDNCTVYYYVILDDNPGTPGA